MKKNAHNVAVLQNIDVCLWGFVSQEGQGKLAPMKYLFACFLAAILSGCTLVPGSHIPSGTSSWYSTSEDKFDLRKQVDIFAITPRLISELRQAPPVSPRVNEDLELELQSYDYRVNPGDVLNVTVWDHPELTIPAGGERPAAEAGNWVHSDGTIFYPYVGEVQVAGLRVTEIREILRERLAEYIEAPQVDVTVAAFRSKRIFVTGEVNQPGTLPITNIPLTLVEAISRAGGMSDLADWTQITLSRNGRTKTYSMRDLLQHGDLHANVVLQPNDIIHVARNDAAKIFVLGEVVEPRSILFGRSDVTLAEALVEAGGFMQNTANASGVFVLRQAPIETGKLAHVFQLDARNATALVLADQFDLRPRDIVYVTAAPVARWNRIVSQLLPTAQALYYVARAEDDLAN